MEVQLLYNVFHHEAVSLLIAIYFHIVGLHAGCSIVSITATLIGKDEYKPVAKIGAIFVIILFSISPIFLIDRSFSALTFLVSLPPFQSYFADQLGDLLPLRLPYLDRNLYLFFI